MNLSKLNLGTSLVSINSMCALGAKFSCENMDIVQLKLETALSKILQEERGPSTRNWLG